MELTGRRDTPSISAAKVRKSKEKYKTKLIIFGNYLLFIPVHVKADRALFPKKNYNPQKKNEYSFRLFRKKLYFCNKNGNLKTIKQ